MVEVNNQPTLNDNDPLWLIRADRICDNYFMHIPGTTLAEAQEAAIKAMKISRDLDSRQSTDFSNDQFALNRLKALGVNPETLELENPKEQVKNL